MRSEKTALGNATHTHTHTHFTKPQNPKSEKKKRKIEAEHDFRSRGKQPIFIEQFGIWEYRKHFYRFASSSSFDDAANAADDDDEKFEYHKTAAAHTHVTWLKYTRTPGAFF